MEFLERYDWLFFLALVVAAVSVLWLRDRLRARGDSASTSRNTRRAFVFLFWVGLPWAVIGIGVLTGVIQTTDDAFNLNHRFSIFAIASIVAVWTALLYWLFVKGGAEELAESGHLRFGLHPIRDPDTIKLLFIAMVVGGVLGLVGFVITNTR